eukprot:s8595_g3.t1
MVGADAELPFPVRTSPIIIAELVHRKLNLCAGGIAQMKKRVPHIRTQEGFASGTASVHAQSVIVPVKIISFAAATTEKQICDLYRGERSAERRTLHVLHSANGAVQVSVRIHPSVTSTPAVPPSAASSLRPVAAPVFFSLQCSYGGCFKAVRSGHLFVSKPEGKQPLLDLAIADSVSYTCAARSSQSSPAAIGCDAKLVRDARCMAGRLITNSVVIQASGWIRPPVTSTPAIPPSAASSLRPVAARMCHASLCASHRPVLKDDFISTPSRLLGLLSQAGAVSHFGCAVLPYCFVARVGIASARSAAKHVCDARCMAGRLITSGAIIQACGWIRPPVASTPAIPPSAASSLRPVAAPVCFSLQRRCGKSWWQGLLEGVVSRHLLTSRQEGKQSLVDYGVADSVPCRSPYRCAVSSSPGCFSMQVREWSCAAGLLMKTRAIVSVSGWIRPPFASARASPPAASSLPPATARVFFFVQCSYGGCFRAVRSGHLFVSKLEASSLSWTLRLQIPCVTVVL